jgi:hypothetical protein
VIVAVVLVAVRCGGGSKNVTPTGAGSAAVRSTSLSAADLAAPAGPHITAQRIQPWSYRRLCRPPDCADLNMACVAQRDSYWRHRHNPVRVPGCNPCASARLRAGFAFCYPDPRSRDWSESAGPDEVSPRASRVFLRTLPRDSSLRFRTGAYCGLSDCADLAGLQPCSAGASTNDIGTIPRSAQSAIAKQTRATMTARASPSLYG